MKHDVQAVTYCSLCLCLCLSVCVWS